MFIIPGVIPTIRRSIPGLVSAILLLLAGCSDTPVTALHSQSWQAGNLRGLELPAAASPDLELIAAYARLTATDLELRFDLLGSPDPFGYDVYLALDTAPGEDTPRPLSFLPAPGWDLMLHLPARGLPRALTADERPAGVRPRILRDGLQDSLTVRISRSALPGNLRQVSFQAFITRPGQNTVEDSIGPYLVSGDPPSAQAPVVLVFWDALPAATPAQALRRWNGAHTGPFGQRHGLGVLLRAAATAGVPVTVLDLKEPARLSALDALGGLPLVRDLQRRNLLLLPDLAYGDPYFGAANLAASRQAARQFGLASSPFLAGTVANPPPSGYQAVFAHQADPAHLGKWGNIRIVPLPNRQPGQPDQAGPEGISIETRRALLEAALSGEPGSLVVLGGALPSSPWGDSLVAGPALAYLAGHPWVTVLDGAGLLHFPTTNTVSECPEPVCMPTSPSVGPVDQARTALEESPNNLFSQLAWQTYRALTDPTGDERLAALRANYLGQTGILLAAADWYRSPGVYAGCETDLDWDGEPECILASEEMFLVFEPLDARLVLGAARTSQGPLQWIGPRSQFIVGLGDPLEWDLEAGQFADPQEIPGAFAGPPGELPGYQAALRPGLAEFAHPTAGTRIVFRLDGKRLQVEIEGSRPILTQLPLTLLTSASFTPGWYDQFHPAEQDDPSTLRWTLKNGPAVQIDALAARLSMHTFAESLPYLDNPEDPDFGYPPGHYIPFPMAVVEVQSEGPLILEITIQD